MKVKKLSYQEFNKTSYLSGGNAPYIEELYDAYLLDPSSVDPEWKQYFSSIANGATDVSHFDLREQLKHTIKMPATAAAPADQQESVDLLIDAYRRLGHLKANINPIKPASDDPRLSLSHYHLSEADFKKTFVTRGILAQDQATLKEIYDALNDIYANTVGYEYSYIESAEQVAWLQESIERRLPEQKLSVDEKKVILKELVASNSLEKYLDVKYVGQKRFSNEGADSFIPMLQEFAKKAHAQGVKEAVIGMAHRGRLNVLLNVMGQSPVELFKEFDGTFDYGMTSGDVKYHRGFSSDIETPTGPLHLSLAFNPSHLEFIDPVVLGSVRARQHRHSGEDRHNYAMAVMVHGDGAFAGQGVVMETLAMSDTRAYRVGGTIHVVLNNQVGFTTENPEDARSSRYCCDLGKMIDAPIFHVNGDDPEQAVKIMLLAFDYRMKFHRDVIIDLVCYRRHGHQEVDEPRATSPLMYQLIDKHQPPSHIYAEKLIKEGIVTQAEFEKLQDDYRDKLDNGARIVNPLPKHLSEVYAENWVPYLQADWRAIGDTSVSKELLVELGRQLTTLPEGFVLQRNVQMIYNARQKMNEGEQPIDWGYAEIMAYATLLVEGHGVRLTGEDVRRGTFFHRQSFVFDQKTGEPYMPLLHLNKDQATVEIYDSLLSETATLGFEYGYAATNPNMLVGWEAQFGDFANGAQVIIDQFISSGWQKWNRLSGLVMLLPHGSEGMGPEHSSARPERFLQLCAQDNMQVCVPTTPAQIFHLLRRQVVRPLRKPLIVMSPKSLLRHKRAVSTLDDLASGQFQLIIPEVEQLDDSSVYRLIACSGKVYYELIEKREKEGIKNVAIVRIEQLYPFPYEEFRKVVEQYPNLKQVVWCQEEPKNQGAWFTSRHRLIRCMPDDAVLCYVGRRSMAAPAAGYPALHKQQLETFLNEAFAKEIQEKDKVTF